METVMETVWKVTLEMHPQQFIDVPKGAELLCAREQFGKIALWFRCNPKASKTEEKLIRIAGTGHEVLEAGTGRYLGTASLEDGRLMLHVFDETPAHNMVF